MLITRRASFVAPLVVALAGTLVWPTPASHARAARPPVIEIAVLPPRARVRRRRRSTRLRVTALRILGRRRDLAALQARAPGVSSRLPLRDSYACGPPRGG